MSCLLILLRGSLFGKGLLLSAWPEWNAAKIKIWSYKLTSFDIMAKYSGSWDYFFFTFFFFFPNPYVLLHFSLVLGGCQGAVWARSRWLYPHGGGGVGGLGGRPHWWPWRGGCSSQLQVRGLVLAQLGCQSAFCLQCPDGAALSSCKTFINREEHWWFFTSSLNQDVQPLWTP